MERAGTSQSVTVAYLAEVIRLHRSADVPHGASVELEHADDVIDSKCVEYLLIVKGQRVQVLDGHIEFLQCRRYRRHRRKTQEVPLDRPLSLSVVLVQRDPLDGMALFFSLVDR